MFCILFCGKQDEALYAPKTHADAHFCTTRSTPASVPDEITRGASGTHGGTQGINGRTHARASGPDGLPLGWTWTSAAEVHDVIAALALPPRSIDEDGLLLPPLPAHPELLARYDTMSLPSLVTHGPFNFIFFLIQDKYIVAVVFISVQC